MLEERMGDCWSRTKVVRVFFVVHLWNYFVILLELSIRLLVKLCTYVNRYSRWRLFFFEVMNFKTWPQPTKGSFFPHKSWTNHEEWVQSEQLCLVISSEDCCCCCCCCLFLLWALLFLCDRPQFEIKLRVARGNLLENDSVSGGQLQAYSRKHVLWRV